MNLRFWLAPAVLSLSAWGQTYVINTLVGNGTQGYTGDSGPANQAQLALPGGIAFDSQGNMYIADSENNVVRKVSGGNITTFAGTGTAGYSGDKGPATAAELFNPTGVAVDSKGNVYIADANNQVVRMVAPSGTITTFAGNNVAGYEGDTGAANQAELNVPVAVAVDTANNVYIADANNNAIRVVNTSGVINTVGNTGSYLNHPDGVAVDAAGDLFVADTGNELVVEFAAGTYNYSVIAGNGIPGFSGDNGPAVNAEVLDPKGVAVDAQGYLYIADTINGRIRKVGLDGTITTIAGTGIPSYSGDGGVAAAAQLFFPASVTLDPSGNLYITDTYNSVIRSLQLMTPAISTNGVVNTGDFVPEISPGALATVGGTNFSSGKASAKIPYPLALADVSVTVNGISAPMLYVQPTLINFQVPWEVQPGQGSVIVTVNGVSAAPATVTIGTAAPGIFLLSSTVGAIVNTNGSINSSTNPAKGGSLVSVYLSGSGPVNPQPADGAAAGSNPYSLVTSSYSATIGQANATVQFAGLAPGAAGLTQFNIIVPTGLQPTTYPLTITINGEQSNTVGIAVTP